ncbi:tRNA lysidine(34) synthetase TilS [Candidatus Enterococcus mangumiae]|uniref:tRNA(Ile)-lysidine synthase n=1 Tax=Candidatus Enterococcus mangumiae TaxID=2230878 RepID=A0ABZ2SW66_9ENTE|nr:tRNA lysidine(34) synthetase TilS [Enterococcus sp. DIV1094]MBO0488663.1 tRNA lysidine(34) synthetase TilS [Enterococcus sp. DIV1094]
MEIEVAKKVRQFKQAFMQKGLRSEYWSKDARILVAVSGGVDSMVLLDCLLAVQKEVGFHLGVVHIDHQLRTVSKQEAAFLETFCREKNLSFHLKVWGQPAEQGIETAARAFRYQTFEQLMRQESYDTLMTAHHGDDQMETVLMKIIRGGQLGTYAGIKESQSFSDGRLIRPLLSFSKEQLYAYAEAEDLPFFEDHTNQELNVQRNRLRHLVVPQLKKENTQAMAHFQKFSQQIQWAEQFIRKSTQQIITQHLTHEEDGFSMPWQVIEGLASFERYFFFYTFFDYVFPTTKVTIKEKQIDTLLRQCERSAGQWQFDLGKRWVIERSYEVFRLYEKKVAQPNVSDHTPLKITPNHPIQLGESEWLGVYTPDQLPDISLDETVEVFTHDLWLPADQELWIDRRQPGDRIQLTETLNKKVSRYFIDKKISVAQRADSWVIIDKGRNLWSLVPFVHSYLSIGVETDKIHYILLYKYQKEAIGRRT